MSTVHNSVETINAAATAIVTAESRVQPTSVQKRRWGSWWSLYWCFGSYKHSKRISHAVVVPKPVLPRAPAPVSENPNTSASIVLPFVAPPSSPMQSDPPSAIQTPAKSVSLTSLSIDSCSPGWRTNIFTIGPYAYETQLVSPPVFSTFTTEPSTASYTPPPEPVQPTTPPSPEVPFAELLKSSLARSQRNNGFQLKFPLSQYDFQPYQSYPDSPVGHLISPGSAFSNSGTSSPLPDKYSTIEFRMGEAPGNLGYDHFFPPNWGSRLGSGAMTPNGGEPASGDSSLRDSEKGTQNDDSFVDHRVSFELNSEDIPTCMENHLISSPEIVSSSIQNILAELINKKCLIPKEPENNNCENCDCEAMDQMPRNNPGEGKEEEECLEKLGSIKEFNFDNRQEGVSDNLPVGSDWWANEKAVGFELGPQKNWTFFSILQPGVS